MPVVYRPRWRGCPPQVYGRSIITRKSMPGEAGWAPWLEREPAGPLENVHHEGSDTFSIPFLSSLVLSLP